MSKRLATIGPLDLSFDLILKSSEAENMNFNYNSIETVTDLKDQLYETKDQLPEDQQINDILNNNMPQKENLVPKEIFDYITISSKDNFINSLIFLNKSNRQKTYIEFIMLCEMQFSYENKFVKNLIKEVTEKNGLFLLEIKIKDDITTKLTFNIKIIDDNDKDNVLYNKSLNLFEKNVEIDCDLLKNNNINFLFNIYSFNFDFFYADFDILWKYIKDDKNELVNFFDILIKKCPHIEIIINFPNDFDNLSDKSYLIFLKKLINLCDIILIDQAAITNFYNFYNNLVHNNPNSSSSPATSTNVNELNTSGSQQMKTTTSINKKQKSKSKVKNINITYLNDKDKVRKHIPKTLILISMSNEIVGFTQTSNTNVIDQDELNLLNFNISNEYSSEFKSNIDLIKSLFIGGFISRYIYTKNLSVSFNVCSLLIKKLLNALVYKTDEMKDPKYFEIYTPLIKKVELSDKKKLENLIRKKENGFVLDCLKKDSNKIKEYNSLYDQHCQRFFGNKAKREHLRQLNLIDRNDKILKDPGMNLSVSPLNLYKNKIGKIKRETMFNFDNNLRRPSKNNNVNGSAGYINSTTSINSDMSSVNSNCNTTGSPVIKPKYGIRNNDFNQTDYSILPRLNNTHYDMFFYNTQYSNGTNKSKSKIVGKNGGNNKLNSNIQIKCGLKIDGGRNRYNSCDKDGKRTDSEYEENLENNQKRYNTENEDEYGI